MIAKIYSQNPGTSAQSIYGKDGYLFIDYQLDPVDYVFENWRFLFLVDTNLTKEKTEALEDKLDDLKTFDPEALADIFNGNYFIIAIEKNRSRIHLLRDASGIKTGYFTKTQDALIVGSVMHDVAKHRDELEYNPEAINQLLYSGYLLNGYTIYEEVEEVKMGHCLSFDSLLSLNQVRHARINLAQKDNTLSLSENLRMLREKTRDAHRRMLSPENHVFLSGGLDSIAMLIALDDLPECKQLDSISFRVKNTLHDETRYAASIAEHLGIANEIREVDPDDPDHVKDLEEKVLKMNNPYFGAWIFGHFKGTPEQMFYAGQDTRLHTPALNEVDKWAFRFLKYQRAWWMRLLARPLSRLAQRIMEKWGWDKGETMLKRNLYKAAFIFDLEKYVRKFYLKLDKEKMRRKGLPVEYYDLFQKHFDFDLDKIPNKRALYNKLVELKWQEQYVYDMRYLQDLGRLNNTYVAMPFYDKELAEFSSSIPFDLATRPIYGRARFGNKRRVIYKYVLRHAFKDKLNDLTFYRAKAVSQTLHQLFNGALGQKVRALLERDLRHTDSFIERFRLTGYVQQFLSRTSFDMNDEDLMARVYYIAMLTVYHHRIFLPHKKRQTSVPRAKSFFHHTNLHQVR
ncbi:MAG: hypothetical protein D6714_08235 [Bacteroidetes bacterium]|nr:MAG: hypothetical protein D6714_08235 [Bacteroidota bacterium]